MNLFHSQQGLFFNRDSAGSVTLYKTSDGREPNADNTVMQIILTESEWASVVCAVSKCGSHYPRWMAARRFHGTEFPAIVN